MKRLLILIAITICSALSQAAETKSTSKAPTDVQTKAKLQHIYDQFSKTIANKNKTDHKALYFYDSALVNIIRKTTEGPRDYYSTDLENFVNHIVDLEISHELIISDEEYTLVTDRLAYSVAKFNGLNDGKPSGTGTDVFAYVKASDGWKLSALHNTVVTDDDKNDYSKVHPLKIDVKSLPAKLSAAIKNKNKNAILELFHSPLAPYINLDYGDNFTYFHNSVAGMATRTARAPYELDYSYSNIKLKVYDQYIAVLTMDYSVKVNGEDRAVGKQMWTLYPTTKDDWRIADIFYHTI